MGAILLIYNLFCDVLLKKAKQHESNKLDTEGKSWAPDLQKVDQRLTFYFRFLGFTFDNVIHEGSIFLKIHQVYTKETMIVIVFGYLILNSIDFYEFVSPFCP